MSFILVRTIQVMLCASGTLLKASYISNAVNFSATGKHKLTRLIISCMQL